MLGSNLNPDNINSADKTRLDYVGNVCLQEHSLLKQESLLLNMKHVKNVLEMQVETTEQDLQWLAKPKSHHHSVAPKHTVSLSHTARKKHNVWIFLNWFQKKLVSEAVSFLKEKIYHREQYRCCTVPLLVLMETCFTAVKFCLPVTVIETCML